ncbi:MAG: hypothetical protein A3D92_06905 [Bacteroidetes bacterium RIFCSPHIGHO2_02_FULL_44_7]|nr:MAG: hypothetical protein A3D92_06905 [Bacteroidetes bacterium RIFCSPHIGHO2_02_FULL_44_7]
MYTGYSEFKGIIESVLDAKFVVDLEKLRTWTSMQALIAVSAIDEHYNVLVSYDELASVSTLQELYLLINSKNSDGTF